MQMYLVGTGGVELRTAARVRAAPPPPAPVALTGCRRRSALIRSAGWGRPRAMQHTPACQQQSLTLPPAWRASTHSQRHIGVARDGRRAEEGSCMSRRAVLSARESMRATKCIGTPYLALWPHSFGQQKRQVAAATAHVQDPGARLRPAPLDRHLLPHPVLPEAEAVVQLHACMQPAAADSRSPWRPWNPFLAQRALSRVHTCASLART